ncbi:GNAT family N-acetyltransferase [Aspergillus homomorphus CBS 101889]|uniref:Acyl-CoA N-acyltransferase n=1 Tax=Aspergillus homomorphus (strain CBS 101889) TaxID=1450537 RepID=A0A395I0C0_ASPHC|nr:acyl-CoA N-acyltransferase [Aspergillus homomorphus CBS 101889]RAL12578.1 acyl-CoA N-acyltransferase [Aspergillus homomorphus CBS 101889]
MTPLGSAITSAVRQPYRLFRPAVILTRCSSTTTSATTTKPSNASLKLHNATPSDASQVTDVLLHSFSDAFNRRLFPPTDDVRTWLTQKFTQDIKDAGNPSSGSTILKIVDESQRDPVIAAFAMWKFYSGEQQQPEPPTKDQQSLSQKWPESADQELCEDFFGIMDQERWEVMGDKKFLYLDILATHPNYHRRGLGSQLLRWGLKQADEAGVETFLASTPQGRRLYEKHGFEVVREYEVADGHVQASMVRSVPE